MPVVPTTTTAPAVTPLPVTADYCYDSVNYDIELVSWYAMLFSFEIIISFGVIVALILMQKNIIPTAWYHERYLKYAPWFTQFLVFMCLARNLDAFVNSSGLPFCGLEGEDVCSGLTSDLTSIFFKFFAVFNFIAATIAAIVSEYFKAVLVGYINYHPMPFSMTKAWLKNLAQRVATFVAEKAVILITAIFSPGMVLLEVIPYTAYCVADQNLKLIIGNAFAHFITFAIMVIVVGLDLLQQNDDYQWSYVAVLCFVMTGIVCFFIQLFASLPSAQMWQIWSFSVAYPALISFFGKTLEWTEQAADAYLTIQNGSGFGEEPPTWSLSEYCAHYLTQVKEGGDSTCARMQTFETAFDMLGTVLDTSFTKIPLSEIKLAVNAEILNQTHSFGSEIENEKAILALTTILPQREGNIRDSIFGRAQLFDRLHILLESASRKSIEEWEALYARRLMPFLALVWGALADQPVVESSFLHLRRFMHDEATVNWFEFHRGPPADETDEWSFRGTDPYPVKFRSFSWGYTDVEAVKSRAGINDATAAIAYRGDPDALCCPRSIANVVSQSWLREGRGDVLYCPGCSLAVEAMTQEVPMVLLLANGVVATDLTNDCGNVLSEKPSGSNVD